MIIKKKEAMLTASVAFHLVHLLKFLFLSELFKLHVHSTGKTSEFLQLDCVNLERKIQAILNEVGSNSILISCKIKLSHEPSDFNILSFYTRSGRFIFFLNNRLRNCNRIPPKGIDKHPK